MWVQTLPFPLAAAAAMPEGALVERPVVQTPLTPARPCVTLPQTHPHGRNRWQKLPSSERLEPGHASRACWAAPAGDDATS